MTIVFSFCLYGAQPKYTHGMIVNAQILQRRFPDARVQIYITEDVPVMIQTELSAMPNVRLIPTPRRVGTANMLDRFRAIDDADCDVMFVRDADSRVHERDAACIEDFLASPTHKLHIIRDHKYHTDLIMGGMWGLRKPESPLTPSIEEWLARGVTSYMTDQNYLRTYIYPKYFRTAMVHDRCYSRDPPTVTRMPFRVPITESERLFVGQVHNISVTGEETVVFDPQPAAYITIIHISDAKEGNV